MPKAIPFRSLFLRILLLCQTSQNSIVNGLVTGQIKIVGGAGGVQQFLPGSYVNNFPRWYVSTDDENAEDSTSKIFSRRLIGTGFAENDIASTTSTTETTAAKSFVNPSSTSDLWYPLDIRQIQFRPTLDVLVNSGNPSYVLAGLEVRVPSKASKDGKEWRNFGINSQPLAAQWTTFDFVIEPSFRVEPFIGRRVSQEGEEGELDEFDWRGFDLDGNVCDEKGHNDSGDRKAKAVQQTLEATQILGEVLANLDESSPVAQGMHIVSIPVGKQWIDLPKPITSAKGEENVVDPSKTSYKLVCFATAEPDASELLTLDEDLVAMSATSVLKVDVAIAASGSESEYLPDAYKPLYLG